MRFHVAGTFVDIVAKFFELIFHITSSFRTEVDGSAYPWRRTSCGRICRGALPWVWAVFSPGADCDAAYTHASDPRLEPMTDRSRRPSLACASSWSLLSFVAVATNQLQMAFGAFFGIASAMVIAPNPDATVAAGIFRLVVDAQTAGKHKIVETLLDLGWSLIGMLIAELLAHRVMGFAAVGDGIEPAPPDRDGNFG